jgi:spore coat polysaccharide biosynthesis protein SpsF
MNIIKPEETLTIIIARMGSSRLPGKILKSIGNHSVLEFIYERSKQLLNWPNIILATTEDRKDDQLERAAERLGLNIFRGSENDVAQRFYSASNNFNNIKWLHRLNADNIFFDLEGINTIYNTEIEEDISIISNVTKEHIPGLSIEIIKKDFYLNAMHNFSDSDKEHVTKYFYDNTKGYGSEIKWLLNNAKYKKVVLDTYEELEFINNLISKFKIKPNSTMKEIQNSLNNV